MDLENDHFIYKTATKIYKKKKTKLKNEVVIHHDDFTFEMNTNWFLTA